ncbi:MAG: hypothetical protein WCD67_03620, partial [Xanthobacteraceae bacterium]
MTLIQGQGLGRLDKTASAVGIFFDIHPELLSLPRPPRRHGRCIVLGIVASPLMSIKARPELPRPPSHMWEIDPARGRGRGAKSPSLGGLAPVRLIAQDRDQGTQAMTAAAQIQGIYRY